MRKLLLKYLGVIAPILVATWYVLFEFSTFAAVLTKALLGVGMLYGVIKYGHDEIDAIFQMESEPVAYALVMLAYALVIAAAMVG
jgi:hypothetical protein